MASSRLPSVQEQIEINNFKAVETPDNNEDEITKARAAARAARRGHLREQFKAKDKEFHEREVADAVKGYNQAHKDAGLPPPVREDESASQVDEDEADDSVVVEDDVVDEDQPVTRLVNGQKVTKKLSEWLITAAPVQAPVSYTPPAQALPPPAPEFVIDEKIVADLQMGDPAKAAEILNKIKTSAVSEARKAVEATQVQSRLDTIEHKIKTENAEIYADPYLANAVNMEFNKSLEPDVQGKRKFYAQGDMYADFEARLNDAVTKVKTWSGTQKAKTEGQVKREQLVERKKKLVTVRGSNARVETPAEQQTGPLGKTFASAEEYAEHVRRDKEVKRSLKKQFGGHVSLK